MTIRKQHAEPATIYQRHTLLALLAVPHATDPRRTKMHTLATWSLPTLEECMMAARVWCEQYHANNSLQPFDMSQVEFRVVSDGYFPPHYFNHGLDVAKTKAA